MISGKSCWPLWLSQRSNAILKTAMPASAVTARQATDEAGHLASLNQPGLNRALGEHRLQERLNEPGTVAPRLHAHATGAAQMLVEGREHFLARQTIMRPRRDGQGWSPRTGTGASPRGIARSASSLSSWLHPAPALMPGRFRDRPAVRSRPRR